MEDFHEEGQGIIRSIAEELKHVHTLAQLESRKYSLKGRFNSLIEVIIAAHEYQARHPEAKRRLTSAENSSSDTLRDEINRLVEIEGAKALLEKIQEESLNRLDAYLQKSKAPR